jgi:hypothetical protein
VINTNIANITFAFFMIHSIYCKINEFHAKFVLLSQILQKNNAELLQDDFRLRSEFGDAFPIVSEHLQCLSKAKSKIPTWADSGCIFNRKAYEQCTSEAVAHFHTTLVHSGKVLNLTGGMGVDDDAFETAGCTVTSLDSDPGMNALFRYNAAVLGLKNVNRLDQSAEDFLAQNKELYDCVYADPDRRPQGNRTSGFVELHSPDVFELYRQYHSIAPRWLIKLSPMTDLSWLLQLDLPMDLTVVEYGGEVKEVLCHLHSLAKGTIDLAVISANGVAVFDSVNPACQTDFEVFSEPCSGAIKAEFNRKIESETGLVARNRNQTYFTGTELLPGELARNFRLIREISGSISQIAQQLTEMKIDRANISSRDFILKTEALKQKLKLKDGGGTYLFFTGKEVKTCFVCEKI